MTEGCVFVREEKMKDALRALMQKYVVVCPIGGAYGCSLRIC